MARVRAYHQRTKHMPGRYAPGPGYMDWANQPDPFRRFSGTRMFELPLVRDDGTSSYDALFHSRKTPPRPLTAESLGLFLELSVGITAWKEFQGTRWSLRSNPSSGNLHPPRAMWCCRPLQFEWKRRLEHFPRKWKHAISPLRQCPARGKT